MGKHITSRVYTDDEAISVTTLAIITAASGDLVSIQEVIRLDTQKSRFRAIYVDMLEQRIPWDPSTVKAADTCLYANYLDFCSLAYKEM